MTYKIIQGDSEQILKTFEDNSIDAIVTDPPYQINFLGKDWDKSVGSLGLYQECLRVLKPGGHALVACGTRTQHRMAVNLEDAGFEIRDIVAWIYGSGFPKSLNISKAIEKSKYINKEKNLILTSVHPSPLSAHRGFFGCKHFSKTNDYLKAHGLEIINW